jgi:uncharacterized membrane protein
VSTSHLTTLARGTSSRILEPRRVVVREPAEWAALWAEHAGPEAPVPPVDFDADMVAAVFAGRREPASPLVAIESVRVEPEQVTFLVAEAPAPASRGQTGDAAAPFHIATLARAGGRVVFMDRPAAVVAAARSGAPRRPSSTGLTPQAAGALAYLAGPLSGQLLLGVESTSRFVRFHAWQSVLGLGSLGLVAIASLLLAFMLLVVSPTAFWVMLWLAALTAVAWLGLWAVCVVQAWRGRRLKLPLAGQYAERLAGRL